MTRIPASPRYNLRNRIPASPRYSLRNRKVPKTKYSPKWRKPKLLKIKAKSTARTQDTLAIMPPPPKILTIKEEPRDLPDKNICNKCIINRNKISMMEHGVTCQRCKIEFFLVCTFCRICEFC